MEKVACICGAGTMGRTIAFTTALHGIYTILYDVSTEVLASAKEMVIDTLKSEVQKNRISAEESHAVWNRIFFTSTLADCRAEIIIEAIVEITEAKSALFKSLAFFNNESTCFASNTSSLSLARIAEQTDFPERIIGLHFFNPANRMKLVEIIRTKYVSEILSERIKAFAKQIGKTDVVCEDAPGFIVNHVARPYYLEALRILEKGMSDMEEIDKLMESAGFKMGPFHLMDLIGNDINFTVSHSLFEALGKPERLKPSGLQEQMVKLGKLGKKSGTGFYQYD